MRSEVRQIALRLAETLTKHGIPNSRLESEVILRHALRYDRAQYFASLSKPMSVADVERAETLAKRRIAREPLAYITRRREFYGLDFIVGPAVLIPRQETELLVDFALRFANEHSDRDILVADIGTGSGAIAIAIAANAPNSHVYATDCSPDALEVASHNRLRHDVTDKVTLLEGDLLAPLPEQVDLIVSNPPYVASHLLPCLAPEVRREPWLALDGGKEGVDVISRLLQQAPDKLRKGGRLIVEISPEQLDAIRATAQAQFPNADISHANDLLGLPRCITISTKQ